MTAISVIFNFLKEIELNMHHIFTVLDLVGLYNTRTFSHYVFSKISREIPPEIIKTHATYALGRNDKTNG